MPVIIFLLMNSVVMISSFIITFKLLRAAGFADSLTCWFIFYFGQIVLSELVLGICGGLYLKNVILLNLGILLFIWVITRRKQVDLNFIGIGREAINSFLSNKVILLIVCVISGFALTKIFVNLVNPPFGWDSLNYHFTFPVEWLKHGNLDIPMTVFDDPSPSYYPINGSLYFLWLMLPLKNVFLADLGQAPFFILAVLSVYNIARKLNIDKQGAFYAAALFALIPNFFKQLQIAYVDVMVTALFLACLNFLFSLNKDFSLQNALIYGISLGLLLGTKTVALPYCILLFIPFIYLTFKNSGKAYLLITVIAGVVIFGGFTYIRNFLDTGNPLYPLDFQLFGRAIFKGVMDKNVYSAHFKIEDYALSKMLFHEGLGIQTLIFILPAIFLGLPVAFIKNRKNLDFNLAYFLILPVLLYLVYRYILPLANLRYLYALLAIGLISGFYILKALNIAQRIINILTVISIFGSMAELAKRQELIASFVLTILLALFLVYSLSYIKQKNFVIKPAFIFLTLIFMGFALMGLERYYIKNEFPGYKKMVKYSGFWPDAATAWDWLNKNTRGDNIAYTGRPIPFPLYGSNFKNNVYYVSVNKTEPAKLHFFPDSRYQWDYDFLSLHKNLEAKGNYRSNADYSLWLNNLLRRDTGYLFVYSLHQTKEVMFPPEDRWAKENQARFIPVFNNETTHIYKLIK